jgi:hypothetical protein
LGVASTTNKTGLAQADRILLLYVLFSPGGAKKEHTLQIKYHAAGILSLTKGRGGL